MSNKATKTRKRSGVFWWLVIIVLLCAAFLTLVAWYVGREWTDTDPVKLQISAGTTSVDGYQLSPQSEQALHEGDLILVNNQVHYTFPDSEELVSVFDEKTTSYKVRDTNVLLAPKVMGPLNHMLDDFYAVTHLDTVNIISGHRTYDYQRDLLDNEIMQKGAVEAARWVASPGGSEHHTGMAIDFGIYQNELSYTFEGNGEYNWIDQNAYKYGFILRYTEEKESVTGIAEEPWHFRYVGKVHAAIIQQSGFCLEEYIQYLRQFEYGKRHLLVSYGEEQYEIYFTKGYDVYLPIHLPYTISGNNVDGFIVTVSLTDGE